MEIQAKATGQQAPQVTGIGRESHEHTVGIKGFAKEHNGKTYRPAGTCKAPASSYNEVERLRDNELER